MSDYGRVCLQLEKFRPSMSVCLSFHLSDSSYSVFCNCLFANFCTYLGDQLSKHSDGLPEKQMLV